MAIYLFPFVVFAGLAVLYELKLLRLNQACYGLALLALALFAGLRFEVGQDWPAYEQFFNELDLSSNPIELYFGDSFERPHFEIGYYLLNYVIRYLGGTYSIVFLVASLFCAYSLYRLTIRFRVNHFYILTIYVSYSFLILHFAQVRQSIAVGFFLLGVDHYLRRKKAARSLSVAAIGLLFQYSGIIYLFLMLAVLAWSQVQRRKVLWGGVAGFIVAAALYLIAKFFDPYALISLLAPASAADKIEIYNATQEATGTGLRVFACYIFLLAGYFTFYGNNVDERYRILVTFAVLSIMMTVALIVMFPTSYVMYSRAYVIACVFQACTAALIGSDNKGWLHRSVFAGTVVVALIYYVRILSFYEDTYVPYQTIGADTENRGVLEVEESEEPLKLPS